MAEKARQARKSRFATDDPRWRHGKRASQKSKVALDERFAELFTNPDFKESCAPPPLFF